MKDKTRISRSFLNEQGIKEVFRKRNSIMKVVMNFKMSKNFKKRPRAESNIDSKMQE